MQRFDATHVVPTGFVFDTVSFELASGGLRKAVIVEATHVEDQVSPSGIADSFRGGGVLQVCA